MIYWEIFSIFLRLGVFGFGGPIATMAMMEEEAVRKRGWITPQKFNEVYAVCKLLPGPVATQMAIYLGRLRGGVLGGLISGGLFILPAFLMVLGLSVLYVHSGVADSAGSVLAGLQAGALVVIFLSTLQLSKPYRGKADAWMIAVSAALIIYFRSGWEPIVIFGFGLAGALRVRWKLRASGGGDAAGSAAGRSPTGSAAPAGALLDPRALSGAGAGLAVKGAGAAAAATGKIWLTAAHLFTTCFKAGILVFGTGLAVVPMLEGDTVQRFHWLTHHEFMDGLAVGQVTPGPVVITATFIGYKAAGLIGAVAATIGIFLPSFVNVLYLVPRVWERFSGTPAAKGFADAAIPAVIGGILATTIRLGYLTLNTPLAILILIGAALAAVFFKPPAWLLIPMAGAAGSLGFLIG